MMSLFRAESLKASQRKAILENPGLRFLFPVEVAMILLSHLSEEMLLRAVVLGGMYTRHALSIFVACVSVPVATSRTIQPGKARLAPDTPGMSFSSQ